MTTTAGASALAQPEVPRSRRRPAGGTPVRGLAPLLVGFGVWELLAEDASISFPPPSSWIRALRYLYEDGTLMPALMQTLIMFALSLVIATVAGASVGMMIGGSRIIDRALAPLLDFFRTLPPPAIIPVAGLLLGSTLTMSTVVIVLAIVWPILLNTASARREMPQVRVDAARVLGLGWFERMWKVFIPSVLPATLLGVKIAVSFSLVGTLLVDILGSGQGAGRLILERQIQFDSAGVWGLVLVIGAFGYALNLGINLVERVILRNWGPTGGSLT